MLILKSPNSGTFRHFHFTSVLSAFGFTSATDDKVADHDNRSFQDGDALQRLFHACQGKDILAKLNSESSIGKRHDVTYASSDRRTATEYLLSHPLVRYDCMGTSVDATKLLDHAHLLVPVGSCSILYAFSSAHPIWRATADVRLIGEAAECSAAARTDPNHE